MKDTRSKSGFSLRGGVPTRQPGLTNSPAVLAWVDRANEAAHAVEIKKGENHR